MFVITDNYVIVRYGVLHREGTRARTPVPDHAGSAEGPFHDRRAFDQECRPAGTMMLFADGDSP